MTTDKQVADSLTTQGKGIPENDVPPQTIIGTFTTIEAVRDAAVRARYRLGGGAGVNKLIMRKLGCKIADIPQHRWQEAGEWFTSLDPIISTKVEGGAEGIIRPLVDDQKDQLAIKKLEIVGVMPPNFDGDGPWAKGWEERAGIIPVVNEASGKAYSDMVAAEHRRQTVQAEAMVNLAVGYTLVKRHATIMRTTPELLEKSKHRISISPEALAEFQRNYTVDQQFSDGSFIISVTPKEV